MIGNGGERSSREALGPTLHGPAAAMFQPWRAEDFHAPVQQAVRPADPWEPIPSGASLGLVDPPRGPPSDFWDPPGSLTHSLRVRPQNEVAHYDFWDPTPPPLAVSTSPPTDWVDELTLPLFEPGARENPFRFQIPLRAQEAPARRRARWLVSLLDIPTAAARRHHVKQFEELFDEYQHHSTFRALTELALEGASAEELITAYQLRILWADCPTFWSIRRPGYRGPIVPDRGETILGWTRARQLAVLSKGLPAERIIDGDWYEDWWRLSAGHPLFWSFLDYATARLESFARGVLSLSDIACSDDPSHGGHTTHLITIDGHQLGSFARTGLLVQSCALHPSKPVPPQQADAAE